MSNIISYIKAVLLVQLFYAFAITLLLYSLPASEATNLTPFQQPSNTYSTQFIAEQTEGTMARQFNLPGIDLATLVFYSGNNMVIDLFLNFATAVPQMFGLLASGLMMFFNVDAAIQVQILAFFEIMIGFIYIIAIMQFLLGMRAQAGIA